HVPYCARRCGYCAFNTYVIDGHRDERAAHREFVAAASQELDVAAHALRDAPPLTSIFIGGGTPSLLDPDLLAALIDHVRARFAVSPDSEITVEAHPDDVDVEVLQSWRAAGTTRVSFGVQSASERVLHLLDRTHTPDCPARAVEDAHRAGIDHVSIELIYGTPGETPDEWADTIAHAVALQIDHVSAYALSIEPGTKLAGRVRSGRLVAPSGDEAADRYELADEHFTAHGFDWYEVSNWARSPAARCRHNLLYWRNHHWWGIGPGAHSHIAGIRWSNLRTPGDWASSLARGDQPVGDAELLDDDQRRLEDVMLGIRTVEGIPLSRLTPDAVASVVGDGLASTEGERLVLTRRGRLLTDTVVRRLTEDVAPASG
ncbi:MAG: radical SAM family heme chaperone HemW, partial [Actinomycetes bacterium]